ncbi:MAG TPA: ABC transporter ATP-binding protein [Clostridiales bacterium]|nr:ABC transporter ATP-binding protein [Clostridiales bacterium]
MWKNILSYLKENKKYAILSPILISIEAVGGILVPFLMGKLVDEGVATGNMQAVWKYGGYMALVVLIALTLALFTVRISAKAAIGLSKNLRQAYFDKIQRFSFSTIDRFSTGSLVTRVTTDITFIQNAFFLMIRIAFRAPVILILSMFMVFSISPMLGIVFIILIPSTYLFVILMMRVVMKFFTKLFRKIDKMNVRVQEKLTGIRVVKTFVRETYESETFEEIAEDVMKTQKKAEKFIVYLEPLGQVVGYAVALFAIWGGGLQLLHGHISAGELTSFISYSSFILMSSIMIMMAFGQIIMAYAPIRRVTQVLDQEPEVKDESHLLEHKVEKGAVEFVDVCFAYDAQKHLGDGLDESLFKKKKRKRKLKKSIEYKKENQAFTKLSDAEDEGLKASLKEELKNMVLENDDLPKDPCQEIEKEGLYGSSKLVLKNINLRIEEGETVGIIGSTGSGKSTLAQLIPRLYQPKKGKVLIDGIDVNEYKVKNLRLGVSMVLQKNVLFAGTIKENLLLGNEDATDEEIKDACIKAQADNFIESFEKGYDTVLEQGASNLSGGQKQRLCIARSLLRKPKILILDDSTSAVDMSTEAKIRKALKDSYQKTTLIIIAQRISSVVDADKIIVMNNGEIDAIGKHDDLIKSNQIYKDVYSSQMEGTLNA